MGEGSRDDDLASRDVTMSESVAMEYPLSRSFMSAVTFVNGREEMNACGGMMSPGLRVTVTDDEDDRPSPESDAAVSVK